MQKYIIIFSKGSVFMLIEFKIENYLSFKNETAFSMVASNIKEHKEDNIISDIKEKFGLLKSAVIYGPNASGKSNLFKAMSFMKDFIFNSSANRPEGQTIPVDKFRLSTETEKKPSSFEITFIHENIRYRYGFTIHTSEVHNEWLYSAPHNRERELFTREKQKIKIGRHFNGPAKLKEITRKDSLFLSVAAQFNNKTAGKILNWFNRFNIISGFRDTDYWAFTTKMLEQEETKLKVLHFLKKADMDIKDILIRKISRENMLKLLPDIKKVIPEEVQKLGDFINLSTVHKKYNENNQPAGNVIFDFNTSESIGTQKFFNLSGPILDTLENGKILVIDEMDSRLHPVLTGSIVKLFNSHNNHKNAQLIFASHNTCLLNKEIFRRDQIWFTEKDKYEVTELYSLLEYRVRNDATFAKDYILGKYGALPFIETHNVLYEEITKN